MEEKEERFTPIAKQEKKKKGCLIPLIVVSVAAILGVIVIGFLLVIGTITAVTDVEKGKPFKEELISGNSFAANKIVVVSIDGIILNKTSNGASATYITKIFDQLAKDHGVKAVILRINSPGGEVVASDIIYNKILAYKKKTGNPVITCMESVAASGGFYIAMASDYIVANRLTLTGSIGVIMQSYNYTELLKKIGVSAETYKSAPLKDILNGARPRTQIERDVIQLLIDETYGEFLKIVATSRNMSVADLKKTTAGDSRILSGKQAFDLKLVDQLGFFEDAVSVAVKKAGLSPRSYKLVKVKKAFSFGDIFMNMNSPVKKIELNVPSQKASVLQPGKLYFMPTM